MYINHDANEERYLLAEEATPQNIPSKLSKQAFPSKKNTLSGIPIAIFHLMMMIISTIDAKQPMTVVNMSTLLNLQPLRKFWYSITPIKLTILLKIPLTVI